MMLTLMSSRGAGRIWPVPLPWSMSRGQRSSLRENGERSAVTFAAHGLRGCR